MEVTITKDKEELERLEAEMRQDGQAFYRFGSNLMQIRNNELYKHKNGGEFQTFEAYCKAIWGVTHRHAERLMGSVKAIENMRPIGRIPATESQTRPLTKLNDQPELQRQAWQKAIETAPEGKVTAEHFAEISAEL